MTLLTPRMGLQFLFYEVMWHRKTTALTPEERRQQRQAPRVCLHFWWVDNRLFSMVSVDFVSYVPSSFSLSIAFIRTVIWSEWGKWHRGSAGGIQADHSLSGGVWGAREGAKQESLLSIHSRVFEKNCTACLHYRIRSVRASLQGSVYNEWLNEIVMFILKTWSVLSVCHLATLGYWSLKLAYLGVWAVAWIWMLVFCFSILQCCSVYCDTHFITI